jgi:hypothetical protein
MQVPGAVGVPLQVPAHWQSSVHAPPGSSAMGLQTVAKPGLPVQQGWPSLLGAQVGWQQDCCALFSQAKESQQAPDWHSLPLPQGAPKPPVAPVEEPAELPPPDELPPEVEPEVLPPPAPPPCVALAPVLVPGAVPVELLPAWLLVVAAPVVPELLELLVAPVLLPVPALLDREEVCVPPPLALEEADEPAGHSAPAWWQ